MSGENIEQNNEQSYIDIEKLNQLLSNFNDSKFDLQEGLFDLDNDGEQDEHEKILMDNLSSINDKEVKISLLQELITQLNPDKETCKMTFNTSDYLLLSRNISKSSKLNEKFKKDLSNIVKISSKILNEIAKENDSELFEKTKKQYEQISSLIMKITSDSEINEEEIQSLYLEFNDLMIIADDKGIKINGWKNNIKRPKESHYRREVKNKSEDLYEKDIENYSVSEAKAALQYSQTNYKELTERTTFSWGSDSLDDLDGVSDVHRFQDRLINKILSGNLEKETQDNGEFLKGFSKEKGGNYLIKIEDFKSNELNKGLKNINFLALKNYYCYLKENKKVESLGKTLIDEIKNYETKNKNLLYIKKEITSFKITKKGEKEIKKFDNSEEIKGKNSDFFIDNPNSIILLDKDEDLSLLKKVLSKRKEKIKLSDINKKFHLDIFLDKKIDIKEDDIHHLTFKLKQEYFNNIGNPAEAQYAEQIQNKKEDGIKKLNGLIEKFSGNEELIKLLFLKLADNDIDTEVLKKIRDENNLKYLIPESVKVYLGENILLFNGYNDEPKNFLEKLKNKNNIENNKDLIKYTINSDPKTKERVTRFITQYLEKEEKVKDLLIGLLKEGYLGEGNQFLYIRKKSAEVSQALLKVNPKYIKYIPRDLISRASFLENILSSYQEKDKIKLITDIFGYIKTDNINDILLLMHSIGNNFGNESFLKALLINKSRTIIFNAYKYSKEKGILVLDEYKEEYDKLISFAGDIDIIDNLIETVESKSKEINNDTFEIENIESIYIKNKLTFNEESIIFYNALPQRILENPKNIKNIIAELYIKLEKETKNKTKTLEIGKEIIPEILKKVEEIENKKIQEQTKQINVNNISEEISYKDPETGQKKLNTEHFKKLYLEEIKGKNEKEIEQIKQQFLKKHLKQTSSPEEKKIFIDLLNSIKSGEEKIKESKEEAKKVTDIYEKYIESGSKKDFDEFFDEEIEKKEKLERQEQKQENNELTEESKQNTTHKEIYQNYKAEFSGLSDFNNFEKTISIEEKKLMEKNPKTAENLITFYNFFKKLNLLSVWKYRDELIKSIGIREINNKDDSLKKEELRKFGNKLLTIIANIGKQEGESKEKINISTLSGVNEKLRNFSGANSAFSYEATYNIKGEDRFASYLRNYGIIGGAYFHTNKLRKSLA